MEESQSIHHLQTTHLRAVHGAVYLKEMDVNEFLSVARKLEDHMEGPLLS